MWSRLLSALLSTIAVRSANASDEKGFLRDSQRRHLTVCADDEFTSFDLIEAAGGPSMRDDGRLVYSVSEEDADADGILDCYENIRCRYTPQDTPLPRDSVVWRNTAEVLERFNPRHISWQGCTAHQICPCEHLFQNHFDHIKCMKSVQLAFQEAGFLTAEEALALYEEARSSDCGKKNAHPLTERDDAGRISFQDVPEKPVGPSDVPENPGGTPDGPQFPGGFPGGFPPPMQMYGACVCAKDRTDAFKKCSNKDIEFCNYDISNGRKQILNKGCLARCDPLFNLDESFCDKSAGDTPQEWIENCAYPQLEDWDVAQTEGQQQLKRKH